MTNWVTITQEVLTKSLGVLVEFLPAFFAALLVLIFGWILSGIVGKLVAQVLKRLKLDRVFENTNWKETLEKAEIKVTPSEFIGEICKWIGFLIFLMAAVEILQLRGFGGFLEKIVSLLANLLVATAIFFVAVVLADILGKIVRAATQKAGIKFSALFEMLVKGVIYLFAGFAILAQLNIGGKFLEALIYGIVMSFTLAVGLAFGLGAKDLVAKLLEDLRKKLSEK